MTDLVDRLNSVHDASSDHYIAGVKEAFVDEIAELDPSARIEDTHYFNHSAIPDFVLSWPNVARSRYVYLRGSYASVIAGGEVEKLTTGDPVLISLDTRQDFYDEHPPITHEDILAQVSQARTTLVTDVGAIGKVTADDGGRETESPLSDLVRANFLRGARGFVDTSRAEQLLASSASTTTEGGITGLIRESFNSDAVTRIERTAQIIDLALGEDFSSLVGDSDDPVGGPIEGVLSQAELQLLVPWLLRHEAVTRQRIFWRYIGKMMGFDDLEALADQLQGANLTPLVLANARHWRAKRAYLGIAKPGTEDVPDFPPDPTWTFRDRVIGADIEDVRLHLVATDQRRLKGREGSALPRWEDISTFLEGPSARSAITSVSLRGIARSITVNAEQSDDIRGDVSVYAASVDDSYFVREIVLRFVESHGESSEATVHFDRALLISQGGTSLEALTYTALQVLSRRNELLYGMTYLI